MQNKKVDSKYSYQRERILEILKNTKIHPTADWIYDQLKKEIPKLSLGTVYRNLKFLKEQGLINELQFGSTFDRYDGKTDPHYHFICKYCEKIFDLDIPLEFNLNEKVKSSTNFKVDSHTIEFFGVCEDCQKEVKN
jgi:Fe2+ or Zn2+ uptake regulation protein